MRQLSRHGSWLVLVLIVALAIRLTAGFLWQHALPEGTRFRFADSESYWILAQKIACGQPYEFGNTPDSKLFRTPGYPLLLAGLFGLVGNDNPHVLWARALSAVCGTLAVGMLVLWTRSLFDETTAWIAGLIAAVYPGAIAMSVLVLAEAPFCPLMLGQMICWTTALRATSWRHRTILAALGGLTAGAATLVRPSWLLFTPFAVLVAIAVGQERRRHVIVSSIMLFGLLVAMLPWWIRNFRITGRFVPTTLQVGASLYDGWNPQATGGSDMYFVDDFRREVLRSVDDSSSLEFQLDRRMRDAAVHWAHQNPGRVVQLAGIKFVRMWNLWPNAAEMQGWPIRIVVLLGYAPLLVLSLWGAYAFTARGWPYVLCFLPAVYFTLLHTVFVSSIRYREPAMLTMTVLAAGILGTHLVPRLKRGILD